MARGKRGRKGAGGNLRTYFKVFASFKCQNEACGRIWNSAHGWEREDDDSGGINCEYCNVEAELVNAVDEKLQLDSYSCPSAKCDNIWQSIHDGNRYPQECDQCGVMVDPEPHPQERFGRHYWFKCKNKNCPAGPVGSEWEDFSVAKQRTQRCSKCKSPGMITRVQKLKRPPPWLLYRRRRRGQGNGGDIDQMEEGPSTHVSEYCDMCQDIKAQGKGTSCHKYKKVVCKVTVDENGGEYEDIVDLSREGVYDADDTVQAQRQEGRRSGANANNALAAAFQNLRVGCA